jgi:hypothetical protein
MAFDTKTSRDIKCYVSVHIYEVRFYANDGGNDRSHGK